MTKRIQQALFYIESHLNDELNVDQLAEISAYSKFHFCRAFKAQMGESVMAYIHRLRLEASSPEVGFGNKPFIEVALDNGYQTPTGFLKAFKKHFEMTPTNYKRITKESIKAYKEILMETPEIINRETIHIVFHRELGDYNKSADIAWEKLSKELERLEEEFKDAPPQKDLEFNESHSEIIGICYDDPNVTDEEKIRYDACIAWSKTEIDFLKSVGFKTKTIDGGKYVKVLHKGSYDSSDNTWYGLYAWIEQNNFELRDEPSFEKYLNTPDKVKSSELLTEIHVPIV